MSPKFNVTVDLYTESLEEQIIAYLAEIRNLSLDCAMDIYYSSRLARQIEEHQYGIENLDYKYLVEDLLENEPELFVARQASGV